MPYDTTHRPGAAFLLDAGLRSHDATATWGAEPNNTEWAQWLRYAFFWPFLLFVHPNYYKRPILAQNRLYAAFMGFLLNDTAGLA